MTKQEMYEFVRDHLRIQVDEKDYYDYGKFSKSFTIRLMLTNPESGKEEEIGGGWGTSISLEDR